VGATATVDTEQVARSVWDNDIVAQASRTVTASCYGSGARTVVFQLKDVADSTTGISGFEIDIEDSVAGETLYGLTTNASGCCTTSLDDGTWTVKLQKTPWSITSPVYPIVSSDTTLTYYATKFDPGSPPSADMCRIWAKIPDLSDEWVAGCQLKVKIPGRYYPVTRDTMPVYSYERTATSNDTGYVYVDVYRSSELLSKGDSSITVKMEITLYDPLGNTMARVIKEIPDQTAWQIVWNP